MHTRAHANTDQPFGRGRWCTAGQSRALGNRAQNSTAVHTGQGTPARAGPGVQAAPSTAGVSVRMSECV